MLGTTILLAISEIRRHLLRSFLTVLGIVIGVAAVVTMVTLGNGATRAIQDEVAGLGANLLFVRPSQSLGRGGGGVRAPSFSIADVEQISSQIAGVAAAVPMATSSRTLVHNGRNYSAAITGTTNDYFQAQAWQPVEGRTFSTSDDQAGRMVCLLGDKVRENLFGPDPAVGSTIRVGNVSCLVIGVMKARGDGASIGSNPDETLIMPIKAVQRRFIGSRDIQFMQIAVDARYDTASVQAAVEALLRERRKIATGDANNFEIIGTAQISQSLSTVTAILTAFMGAVGGVSLVVGGIGIMNIMLVSVIERTREIGIRLAIGAVASEVLMQFLVEAIVLSSLGGLIGLVIAFLGSLALAPALGVPFIFDWKINLGAFLFSGFIGVVFGYFPARRAAALSPIDALRHE